MLDRPTAPKTSERPLQAPATGRGTGSPVYSRKGAILAGLAGLSLPGLGVGMAPGLLAAPIGAPPRAARPAASPAVLRRLVSGTRDFGFDLFGRLITAPGAGTTNVFISPFSIATALSMAYNGARGATAAEMAAALKLNGLSLDEVNAGYATLLPLLTGADPAVRVDIANSLWARDGVTFNPAFLRRVGAAYQARLTNLDFGAPHAGATINAWVRAHTNGMIDGIVPAHLDPYALLYLINAIYFKGQWTSPFEQKLTTPHPFTSASGARKSVPMMTRHGGFPYYQGPDYQAIELAYGAGKTGMIVVLPAMGASLARVQARLIAPGFDDLVSRLANAQGALSLPRFSVSYSATPNLNGPLARLGMGRAFIRDEADFTAMFASPPPAHAHISAVAHKAVMHVDEKGTTAAAVTSIGVVGATAVRREFSMVVDRPFFCAIREHTSGAILFVGQITDPETA